MVEINARKGIWEWEGGIKNEKCFLRIEQVKGDCGKQIQRKGMAIT